MEDEKIIPQNFISSIKQKKSSPKKNKPFSNKQVETIRKHLNTHDPYLRVFIQFMSYAFLRNKEVCNIRIKDIDLDSKRIFIGTKVESQTAIPIIKELIKPIGNKSATDAINKIISESRNIEIKIARNQKTVFQKEVKLVLDFFGFEY